MRRRRAQERVAEGLAAGLGALASPGGGYTPPGYQAVAVNFDGSNDYLTRGANLTGSVDGKIFSLSCWVKFAADGSDIKLVSVTTTVGGSNERFYVTRNSSNLLRIFGKLGGTTNLDAASTTETLVVADGWQHLAIAIDLSDSGKRLVYINGAAVTMTWTTYLNGNIDFGQSDWAFGGRPNGSHKMNGDLSDFWFDLSYVDFSDADTLAKFYSGGKPVDLGEDGSTPTESIPIVYLSGGVDAWHTNKGDGGGFTENGALTDASSSPSD